MQQPISSYPQNIPQHAMSAKPSDAERADANANLQHGWTAQWSVNRNCFIWKSKEGVSFSKPTANPSQSPPPKRKFGRWSDELIAEFHKAQDSIVSRGQRPTALAIFAELQSASYSREAQGLSEGQIRGRKSQDAKKKGTKKGTRKPKAAASSTGYIRRKRRCTFTNQAEESSESFPKRPTPATAENSVAEAPFRPTRHQARQLDADNSAPKSFDDSWLSETAKEIQEAKHLKEKIAELQEQVSIVEEQLRQRFGYA
jgi:hypothetical protein